MVLASCHPSGIRNFEVASEKNVRAHTHNNDDVDENNSNHSKEVLMGCIQRTSVLWQFY
jgi:hypothetical protein